MGGVSNIVKRRVVVTDSESLNLTGFVYQVYEIQVRRGTSSWKFLKDNGTNHVEFDLGCWKIMILVLKEVKNTFLRVPTKLQFKNRIGKKYLLIVPESKLIF